MNVNNNEKLKLIGEKISKSLKGHLVWNKGKENIYSEETKKKMSETRKRLFKEGKLISPNKKNGVSLEVRKKISIALKGKSYLTEEGRKKITLIHKGKIISQEHKEKLKIINTGKKYTPETLKKMSIAQLGKKLSEETKMKISKIHKGRKYSLEHNKKLSISLKGKYVLEKSWNWKGGISFENYPPEFNSQLKEQIRKRDNSTCKICQTIENGRKFCVHHIDYNKKNNEPINLITLCRVCHSKTNLNRIYWNNYLTNLIKLPLIQISI